ncbi:hypothetical protein QTN25_006934 [Entamoeba marina]
MSDTLEKKLLTKNVKRKSPSSDYKYVRNKRELRDCETYQHAFLLGILNEFCSFTIKSPRKKSVVTSNNLVLLNLIFDNENLDISGIVESKYKPQYFYDTHHGMKPPAAFRRYDKNKKIYVQLLLIDICFEVGYFFNLKQARKSKKNLRREVIESIFFDNVFLYDSNEIEQRGKCLNDYYSTSFKSNSIYTIEKNDPSVKAILINPITELPVY